MIKKNKNEKGAGWLFWPGVILIFLSIWNEQYHTQLWRTGWGMIFVALFLALTFVIKDNQDDEK